MNKIRVIDLLNKIANGEEVPKEIEFRNHKFVFDGARYLTNNGDEEFTDYLAEDGVTEYWLNREVEIIEEDKEIEELDIESIKVDYVNNVCNRYDLIEIFGSSINKLRKELNELKKGK